MSTSTLLASVSPEPTTARIGTISSRSEVSKGTRTPSPIINQTQITRNSDEPLRNEWEATSLNTKEQSPAVLIEESGTEYPVSILSRTPHYQHLNLSDQFEKLLAQSPTHDLEPHQQQSVVSQIVQWWEGNQEYSNGTGPIVSPASMELRNAAIPILHNMSAQVLDIFAVYNMWDIKRAVANPHSQEGQVFETYLKLFRILKCLYHVDHKFILSSNMVTDLSEGSRVIHTTNLASFMSACFGSELHGQHHLRTHFSEIFSKLEGVAPEWQSELYLRLKFLAYVSTISSGEKTENQVLEEMYFKEQTVHPTPNGPAAVKVSNGFTDRTKSLRLELDDGYGLRLSMKALKERYSYEKFLQQLTAFAYKHFMDVTGLPLTVVAPMCDNIESMHFVADRTIEYRGFRPATDKTAGGDDYELVDTREELSVPPDSIPAHTYASITNLCPKGAAKPVETLTMDIIAQAARAAQAAISGISQVNSEDISSPYNHSPYGSSLKESSSRQQSPITNNYRSGHNSPQVNTLSTKSSRKSTSPLGNSPSTMQLVSTGAITDQPQIPHDSPYLQNHHNAPIPPQETLYYQATSVTGCGLPGQSQPTAVLYERARQVANSKSSNVSRNKTSNISQRRPWTLEEEQALMDGIDQVKGPHWSQILILYGPGGTINETLRDRTQVQLKDKARNLKLFFLKSKIEVPCYLSFVTGELKSRAPSHVSAFDNTPPRSIEQSNGIFMSSASPSTSRNRIIPAQMSQAAMMNSILSLSQSNDTYSSPYAAIPGSETIVDEADTIEDPNHNDADHQNVADLAASAAAQVAAALANFNVLDLPGFGISTSVDSAAENSLGTSHSGFNYQNPSPEQALIGSEQQPHQQQHSHQTANGITMPDIIQIDARS